MVYRADQFQHSIQISSYSGNVQTIQRLVGGKNGAFQNLACIGLNTLMAPDSRGIYMGLDSDAAGGIDICADTNQYIDFTTMLHNYEGRFIYNLKTIILK